MKTIAIHNGKFHADDVFSVAILKLIYPEIKVIRTRNPKKLSEVDARIDVGGKYNPETNDYDHHQAEFKEKRPNGIPYASAGLIWKRYGMEIVKSKEIWRRIDEKIIQFLDADDNGIKTYETKTVEPYTMPMMIVSLNPVNKNEEEFNKNFEQAIPIAIQILKKEIENARILSKAKEIIKEEISKTDKEYLILKENLPFHEAVIEESKKIKYVIKEDPVEDLWAVIGVRKEKDSFETRKPFPKEWAGLENKELADVTEIEDAVFCHKACFIVIAKSKEGAIKLAEIALKEK